MSCCSDSSRTNQFHINWSNLPCFEPLGSEGLGFDSSRNFSRFPRYYRGSLFLERQEWKICSPIILDGASQECRNKLDWLRTREHKALASQWQQCHTVLRYNHWHCRESPSGSCKTYRQPLKISTVETSPENRTQPHELLQDGNFWLNEGIGLNFRMKSESFSFCDYALMLNY